MPKYEITYSKQDTVIVEANSRDEAEDKVFSFLEMNWFDDDRYSHYGLKAAYDENGDCRIVNKIIGVKELPETALDVMLRIIRDRNLTKH